MRRAASLYEVGFNHFFRGKDDGGAGDQVFYQGHAAPGIYARAFLEGRLTEDQLDHFRRETVPGQGLRSYPHPRLMPDFWEFPTVSMGLGPISAIYQARYNRYLQNRGLLDTRGSRVWAFLGDGETDEPESLGALHVAAREGLDNLTFVVNCNLQRLDGPVRGNGKIIQELEAVFRGSGWNVIKVIWAREWDELLARDVDGVLVEKMNNTLDGEFQKYSVAGGAYIREHFFGPDPRLRKLVEHLSDDDLAKLRRGGHDYRKVYAAYKPATEWTGAPTVILAHTVKGWTLGPGVEARNITHQAKKLSEAELKIFRDRIELPIPDAKLKDAPYYHPGPDSEEVQYLRERRKALGGFVPRRTVRRRRCRSRRPTIDAEFAGGLGHGRLDDDGLQPDPAEPDPRQGARAADRADHPGRGADVRHGPALQGGRDLRRARPALRAGRLGPRPVVPRGGRRPGPRGGHHRGRLDGVAPGRGDVVRDPRLPDDPVLHLLLDVRVPADGRPDLGAGRRPRPRLHDGRDGRPDDPERRGPPARGRPFAPPRLDDPERSAPTTRPSPTSWRRSSATGSSGCTTTARTSSTTSPSTTRTTRSRRSPTGVDEASSAGIYRFAGGARPRARRRTAPGSSAPGAILQQVIAARDLLAEQAGIAAEIYSRAVVPAAAPRRARGRAVEPAQPEGDAAGAVRLDGPRPGRRADRRGDRLDEGRCPTWSSRWLPPYYVSLGTDGFGRSDTREALRSLFEIDPPHIAAAAVSELARCGAMPADKAAKAIAALGVDPTKLDPTAV